MATASTYAKRPYRVEKDELCMILALWMEESPFLEEPTVTIDKEDGQKEIGNLKGVGAVLALPNERIFAIDCSRNDVHGVANLLIKFPHHAEGSTIFSSRKPCSFCTKLLVQCKVARVFYLPIEPERNEQSDIRKVDHLFKVSQVAQSVFVPRIDKPVITAAADKPTVYSSTKKDQDEQARIKYKDEQMNKQWGEEWTGKLKDSLPWLAFDKEMETQVREDMKHLFDWVSKVAILDPPDDVQFKEYGKEPPHIDEGIEMISNSGPEVQNMKWQKLALHLSRMAKIIAQKTDDPKTGVGSVILMENKEIVAVGWNGFPSKALYGEFPRASDKDWRDDNDVREDKMKYPYVIHAEQNALFTRNKESIKGKSATLFVTKTPCHECVPLLIQAGVENVVLPGDPDTDSESSGATVEEKRQESASTALCQEKSSKRQLDYERFFQKINDGKFMAFVSYRTRIGNAGTAKRQLEFENDEDEKSSKLPKKE